MTIRDNIIKVLMNHPEGIDDDDLARVLNLSARQQANSRCRQLAKEGLVIRRQFQGKIHNYWAGKDIPDVKVETVESNNVDLPRNSDWFWEGNVQSVVINFLVTQGYKILSAADTATHQTGIDIKAIKDNNEFWVTVKGYPRDTQKTNPSVQASHWFKQAIFDIIEYRQIRKDVKLAAAFPDFRRYRRISEKITWFKPVANFEYIWVDERGNVSSE